MPDAMRSDSVWSTEAKYATAQHLSELLLADMGRRRRTGTLPDLLALRILEVNDNVVDQVVPVGVVEHLQPEGARLLEVDCVKGRSLSIDSARCDRMGMYSRSVTKLKSVLA